MSSLDKIQKLSKLGKILCCIVFVFCMIGIIGSVIGIAFLAAGVDAVHIGGITLKSIVQINSGASIETANIYMAVAIIFCSGEAVIDLQNCKEVEMDHTVENIWIQGDEVAKGMQQVNVSTQNNYQAIEQVNAATQENSTGVEMIEDKVVRIRRMAEEWQKNSRRIVSRNVKRLQKGAISGF